MPETGKESDRKVRRIHFLQHEAAEGPGSIKEWAVKKAYPLSGTHFYEKHILPSTEEFDWLIIMGGSMNALDEQKFPWQKKEKEFIKKAIDSGKVVLGICLGAQLLANILKANVYIGHCREIGWFPVYQSEGLKFHPLAEVLPREFEAFHWHSDTFDTPKNATRLATSKGCKNQGFVYNQRVIALQFHLETTFQSAKETIESARGELVEAPYVQKEKEMMQDENRFRRIKKVMFQLLDYMDNMPI